MADGEERTNVICSLRAKNAPVTHPKLILYSCALSMGTARDPATYTLDESVSVGTCMCTGLHQLCCGSVLALCVVDGTAV